MSKHYEIVKLPGDDHYTIGSEFMETLYGIFGRNDRLGIGGRPFYSDHASWEWVLGFHGKEPVFFNHFQTGRKYLREIYGIRI